MKKLEDLLNKFEAKVSDAQTVNEKVSKSSVSWHIEHSLLVLKGVISFLETSTPSSYKWNFNLLKNVIFSMKKIPRGKGKAPKIVSPSKQLDEASLLKLLSIAREKVMSLDTLPSNKYFQHPVFGQMKLKETIKFLEIHTMHHLKIIEDILKNK